MLASSSSSAISPSASLAANAGIGTMAELATPEMAGNPGYAGYLNFEVAALPEVLKASGYRTYMAGKWHLGHEAETSPHARGFDETFTLLPGGGSHWADRRELSPPQTMIYRRNGEIVESLPDDFYSTQYYTDTMLGWLERDQASDKGGEQPFFAYLSYTAPHDPLHAPQAYIDKYTGMYDDGWDALGGKRLQRLKELGIVSADATKSGPQQGATAWVDLSDKEKAEAARDMEVYAAMIDYMDEQIDRVITYLKETGEYDNTMVLFFSDNGANGAHKTAYPGQTEEFMNSFNNDLDNRGAPNSYIDMGPNWAQASVAPSRMYKLFPTEGGIRSPLLIKLPGDMVKSGQMSHDFLHVRDVMPTILDLAQITPPDAQFDGRQVRPMQGTSVLDFLAGKAETPPAKVSQVGYELFGLKAFISGHWKILSLPKPYGTGIWELFDLQQDPSESTDLSEQNPAERAALIAQWDQYQIDNGILDMPLDVEANLE